MGDVTRHDLTTAVNEAVARVLRGLLDAEQFGALVALAEHWGRPLSHTAGVVLLRGLRDAAAMSVCRDCACTEFDACVDDDGEACSWAEDDLCSRCAEVVEAGKRVAMDGGR